MAMMHDPYKFWHFTQTKLQILVRIKTSTQQHCLNRQEAQDMGRGTHTKGEPPDPISQLYFRKVHPGKLKISWSRLELP